MMGHTQWLFFMRIALSFLLASLAGEGVCRLVKMPRITGYALAGLLLGPLGLDWVDGEDLPDFRFLVELTLTLLLFELGVRVSLRWLKYNPWVIASSLLESGATFIAVFAVLMVMGLEVKSALSIAVIAMGTSPVIVLRMVTEMRAQGQVTQRLLVLCGLNTVYSVVFFYLIMGWFQGTFHGQWFMALFHSFYLLVGSLGMGLVLALSFKLLRRMFELSDEQSAPVLFGLLLLLQALLVALELPVFLAPLLGGVLAKHFDPRPHLWPRHFGTAGSILTIILFMMTGSLLTRNEFMVGAETAMIVLLVRFLAKGLGVLLLGPISGLNLRQSLVLGVVLIPMAEIPLVELMDMRTLYPQMGVKILPIVFSMMNVLEVLGPMAVQWGLIRSQEFQEKSS
ncbi:Sodium/hydrogen exchanger family protein [mine drainage metagenome]|uniref:Sodium/hydrogen exchanger family protein n=1 Tax=mine drainage metagenome TaxID=410659 RepID=A0A3P3ZLM9_9ZZZZ